MKKLLLLISLIATPAIAIQPYEDPRISNVISYSQLSGRVMGDNMKVDNKDQQMNKIDTNSAANPTHDYDSDQMNTSSVTDNNELLTGDKKKQSATPQ